MEDGQRPVKLAARAGYIGVLDLGGDLKIRCVGTGRVQKQETENGIVYRCAGRKGGEVVLLGSHFTFRGFATQLQRDAAGGSERHLARPLRRPGRTRRRPGGRSAPERAPKPARETDEIPSLEELAAMLEGLDG